MVGGIYGKFGNVGNVDSVTCRYIRAGEGTNPALCGGPVSLLKGGLENRLDRGIKAALPRSLDPNQTTNATGAPVGQKLGAANTPSGRPPE